MHLGWFLEVVIVITPAKEHLHVKHWTVVPGVQKFSTESAPRISPTKNCTFWLVHRTSFLDLSTVDTSAPSKPNYSQDAQQVLHEPATAHWPPHLLIFLPRPGFFSKSISHLARQKPGTRSLLYHPLKSVLIPMFPAQKPGQHPQPTQKSSPFQPWTPPRPNGCAVRHLGEGKISGPMNPGVRKIFKSKKTSFNIHQVNINKCLSNFTVILLFERISGEFEKPFPTLVSNRRNTVTGYG